MGDLENRIKTLEQQTKGQDTMSRADINLNDVVRKLGLDPNKVSAIAKEKNQSRAEVIAGELGMSYADFIRALKLRTQAK